MSSHSKGKNKKTATSVIERPGINWRVGENSQEHSSLILSVVKEAAMLAPIATLKQAACSALLIFKTTQVCKLQEQSITITRICSMTEVFSTGLYRLSRKTKRHTNDLASILEGSSLPFGARLRKLRILKNGCLQKCEIFLKTYHSKIDNHF